MKSLKYLTNKSNAIKHSLLSSSEKHTRLVQLRRSAQHSINKFSKGLPPIFIDYASGQKFKYPEDILSIIHTLYIKNCCTKSFSKCLGVYTSIYCYGCDMSNKRIKAINKNLNQNCGRPNIYHIIHIPMNKTHMACFVNSQSFLHHTVKINASKDIQDFVRPAEHIINKYPTNIAMAQHLQPIIQNINHRYPTSSKLSTYMRKCNYKRIQSAINGSFGTTYPNKPHIAFKLGAILPAKKYVHYKDHIYIKDQAPRNRPVLSLIQHNLDLTFGKNTFTVNHLWFRPKNYKPLIQITHHLPSVINYHNHTYNIHGLTNDSTFVKKVSPYLSNMSSNADGSITFAFSSKLLASKLRSMFIGSRGRLNIRATNLVTNVFNANIKHGITIPSQYYDVNNNKHYNPVGIPGLHYHNKANKSIFCYKPTPSSKPFFFCAHQTVKSCNHELKSLLTNHSISQNEHIGGKFLNSLGISYIHGMYFNHLHGVNFKNKSGHTTGKHGRLHLDFFIPKRFSGAKQDIGIEVDGTQHNKPVHVFGGTSHFSRQVKNDQRKNIYCKMHHIKLLRIPMFKTLDKSYMHHLYKRMHIPYNSSPDNQKRIFIKSVLDQDLLPDLSYQNIDKALSHRDHSNYVIRHQYKDSHLITYKNFKAHANHYKALINHNKLVGQRLNSKSPFLSYNEKLQAIYASHNYKKSYDPKHYTLADAINSSLKNKRMLKDAPISKILPKNSRIITKHHFEKLIKNPSAIIYKSHKLMNLSNNSYQKKTKNEKPKINNHMHLYTHPMLSKKKLVAKKHNQYISR